METTSSSYTAAKESRKCLWKWKQRESLISIFAGKTLRRWCQIPQWKTSWWKPGVMHHAQPVPRELIWGSEEHSWWCELLICYSQNIYTHKPWHLASVLLTY
jgi:hypothetical protein